jgi:PGF-pre-PGF domain-containing protein
LSSKLNKSILAIVLVLLLFISGIFLVNTRAASDKTSMDVKSRMSKSENVPVIIILKDPLSIKTFSKENAVSELKSRASTSQQLLADLLKEQKSRGIADKIKHFWIVNAIAVEASPELIEKLSMRDDVERIELDAELHIMDDFSTQVSQGQIDNATSEIRRINTTKVWEPGIDGTGINVSVIDTGINASHPDIAGRVIKGYDFVNNDGNPADDNGHGTHVAGTVGGNGSRGTTTGVAPNVNLFGVKVLNATGSGYESNVILGIEWSVSNGANVISMSLGGELRTTSNCDVDNYAMATAINNAVASNVVVVAAAGNNADGVSSPGCIQKSIAVGAVDSSDTIASFSGRGAAMTDHGVVAPGVSITSLDYASSGYVLASGTSMATPHVSGTIALILHAARQLETSLSPSEIKSILETTSVDLGMSGMDNTFGAGRLDVFAAVKSLDRYPPAVIANPTLYSGGNAAAKNGENITLNATITDVGFGVINATANVSSINSSLTNIALTNASGFWTNSSVIVNASDGIYYLNVTAYDNVSNVNSSVRLSVTVDNTPPLVYINQTSYQRGSAANNGSVIGLNVSASDNLAGLKNASVNASLINNTGTIELSNYSSFWKGNATFDKSIADGNYSLNVTFFDNAGNINNNVQVNISIDNTPPSVTDVSLSSSQFINVTGFTNISANITSLDTVSQVNESEVFVRVMYPNGTLINYSMKAGEGSLFYYNFTDTAQYGRFNVTILANDTTGNTNSTQKIQFATAFITNNESVVIQANNSTVVNAPLSNTTLYLFTNNTSFGTINITRSRINITSNELNITNPGLYVNVSVSSSIRNNLSYVIIYVNYTDAEVSSYTESTLRLYRWNTSSSSWDSLSGAGSYPYVNNAGVDTANNFVWANLTELSEFAVSGELYVPPLSNTATSGSIGGGGGGGGGGTTGENFTNIILKEKYYLFIQKDRVTSYRFTNTSNPIIYINITGNISAGDTATQVEVLRAASTLMKKSAPGTVYKNINIWVGTSGFAVTKNLKEAVIRFRVENSWLQSNNLARRDVGMVKWKGSEWVELETAEKEKDETYSYFEANTNSFSSFAITGLKSEVVPAQMPVFEVTETPATAPAPTPIATEKKTGGFEVILASTAFYTVYLFGRKRS